MATQTQTLPARIVNPLTTLQKLLTDNRTQIAMALPKHITPERMIRMAMSAVAASPLLMKCDQLSVAASLVQCSILGLEPNTPLGEAFLIPYWNTKSGSYHCQMQTGYQGLVKLALNSGQIELCDAQPVHEADEFDFQKGTDPYIIHKPPKAGDRGKVIGYYGLYVPKNGRPGFEYMTVEQINEHRDRYSQGAYKREKGKFVLDGDGNKILQGPWKDSPDWMYRKTPLRQALKLAPKSIEMRALHSAVKIDEYHEAGQTTAYIDVPLSLVPADADTPEVTASDPPTRASEKKDEAKVDSKVLKASELPPDAAAFDPGTKIKLPNGKVWTNGTERSGWAPVDA